MKAALSTCLDMLCLISAFFLTLTLSGGEVRWTTSYFAFQATHWERPFFLCLLLIGTKTAFGLTRGLFASLSGNGTSIVSRIAARIHHLELALRTFYVANRINILLAAATSVVLLGSLEVALRYFVQALPGSLANHLATGYTTEPSGIYRVNADTKMLLMRPNYEREMYFNGYRWHHKTDGMGFRNPLDRPSADVVLLGDSMIYGHGVEETSTLRHYLEKLLGGPVANLGVQGASIHQEYQILKRFGLNLHPRYALVFFLGNDIRELTGYLTDAEMQRLLRLPVSDHSTPYVDITPPSDRPLSDRLRLSAYVDTPYVTKAYEFLKNRSRIARAEGARASAEARQSATHPQGDPGRALALQVHLRVLSKIQDLAEQHRFRLTNVFIYTGGFSEEPFYEGVLKSYCEAQGIDFYSLRDGFEAAMGAGEKPFLVGDGHFADDGARLAAKLVYQHMMASAGQRANAR